MRRVSARWVMATGATLLAVLVAVGVYVRAETQEDFTWGNETSGPVKVGEPVLIGMDNTYPGATVQLKDVTPVIVENTAKARVETMVCQKRERTGIIMMTGSLRPYCRATRATDGYQLSKAARDDEFLLVRVTARQPGRVRIDGLKVAYSRGWRSLWMPVHGRAGITAKLDVR